MASSRSVRQKLKWLLSLTYNNILVSGTRRAQDIKKSNEHRLLIVDADEWPDAVYEKMYQIFVKGGTRTGTYQAKFQRSGLNSNVFLILEKGDMNRDRAENVTEEWEFLLKSPKIVDISSKIDNMVLVIIEITTTESTGISSGLQQLES